MQEQIKKRTKQIGLEVIKLIDEIPNKTSGLVISKQIVRSSTSVGANYRAACRAKSPADFINKLKIVEEEADEPNMFANNTKKTIQIANMELHPTLTKKLFTDETLYWLEILEESCLTPPESTIAIKKEINEITAIIVSSIKTMKEKHKY